MRGAPLPSLTSLRFFAAMIVAAFHASMYSTPSMGADGIMRYGFVGVTFFFVLSGFVLAWTWKPHERVRAFYLRRFARVYPLHVLTALAAFGLWAAGVQVSVSWAAAGSNLFLVQAWVPSESVIFGVNGLSWSLSDEAFFYLLFPLLGALASRLRPLRAALLAAVWLILGGFTVALAAPSWAWFLYSFPLYRVGEFLIGVALALALQAGTAPRVPLWIGGTLACGGYLSQWLVNRATGGFVDPNLWFSHLLVLPGFATLILAAAQHDLAGGTGWLHSRALVKLGQWSFALYLVHGLCLRAARPWLLTLPDSVRLLLALAVLGAAQAIAALLYEYFERPVEKRIRAWGHQRESILATNS